MKPIPVKVFYEWTDRYLGKLQAVEIPDVDSDEATIEVNGEVRKIYLNPNIPSTFAWMRKEKEYMVLREGNKMVDTFVYKVVRPPVGVDELRDIVYDVTAADSASVIEMEDGRCLITMWYD